MKVEPAADKKLPFTFSVPPLTVKVPLFVKLLLFSVQPTVRSPPVTTNVAPVLITVVAHTLPAVDAVTV